MSQKSRFTEASVKSDMSSESEKVTSPCLFWPLYVEQNHKVMQSEDILTFPEIGLLQSSLNILAAWWEEERNRNSVELTHEVDSQGRDSPGIDIFWSSFLQSKSVIFIDKFFSLTEFNKMVFELKKIVQEEKRPDIKIICSGNDKYFPCRLDTLKKIVRTSILVCPISDWDTKCRIHDRFAIMDSEIWHFGSTLGGAKAHINACSRGWLDRKGGFRKYVETLIQRYGNIK